MTPALRGIGAEDFSGASANSRWSGNPREVTILMMATL
jgi:hypothetical protein